MEAMERLNDDKNFWSGRPVLVTGGAGFIGAHLTNALVGLGADLYILDKKERIPAAGGHYDNIRNSAKYFCGDICDKETLKNIFSQNKISTIFHLAAEAIVGKALANPADALDTNIKGTWTLLDAVREVNPRIEVVIASSDKAYGDHEVLPYTEEFSLKGRNPYDCSKSCTDLVAQMYANTYGLPICVTRCGNVYGGGDLNFSRLIPDTIRSLHSGRRPEIRSDGMYRRDYNFVGDIVSAYILSAEELSEGKSRNEVFNFGTGAPERAIDVVSKISGIMNTSLEPIILASAKYEIKDQYLDASKAKKVLGWQPRVALEDGLKETISWYRDFFDKHGVS